MGYDVRIVAGHPMMGGGRSGDDRGVEGGAIWWAVMVGGV